MFFKVHFSMHVWSNIQDKSTRNNSSKLKKFCSEINHLTCRGRISCKIRKNYKLKQTLNYWYPGRHHVSAALFLFVLFVCHIAHSEHFLLVTTADLTRVQSQPVFIQSRKCCHPVATEGICVIHPYNWRHYRTWTHLSC